MAEITANKRSEFVRGWPVLLASTVGVGLGVSALPFYTAGLSPVVIAAAAASTLGYPLALISSAGLMLLVAILFARAPRFERSEPGEADCA